MAHYDHMPQFHAAVFRHMVLWPWSHVMNAITLILAETRALTYSTKLGRINAFREVLIPTRTGTIQFNNIFLSFVPTIWRALPDSGSAFRTIPLSGLAPPLQCWERHPSILRTLPDRRTRDSNPLQ